MGQSVESNGQLQDRHVYYRRCQAVMGNGEQCRCPAQKGSEICRNHAEQKRTAERRLAQKLEVLSRAAEKMAISTGRKHAMEDLFESRLGIQLALDGAMRAIVDDRIDEKTARELLGELDKAARKINISPSINNDEDREIAVIARNRRNRA